MDRNRFGTGEDDTETSTSIRLYTSDEDITHTIDLNRMFTVDLTQSGSFDLTKVHQASFGKLLQAMSVPTLLVARSHAIAFANAAFSEIAKGGYETRNATFSLTVQEPQGSPRASTTTPGERVRGQKTAGQRTNTPGYGHPDVGKSSTCEPSDWARNS